MESKDHSWKFLEIRDSITEGQFIQDKIPVMEFLELPGIAHRAAMSYKFLNRLQENICKNMRYVWQKNLGCELNAEIWLRIFENAGNYMKEAKGEFTQYRLIHCLISPHLNVTERARWLITYAGNVRKKQEHSCTPFGSVNSLTLSGKTELNK